MTTQKETNEQRCNIKSSNLIVMFYSVGYITRCCRYVNVVVAAAKLKKYIINSVVLLHPSQTYIV